MIQPEILAPAGGGEQLYAAVRCGTDAVYLGADGFNARRSAHNFDREALRNAVMYCHERGVRVYLTMNTLVLDDELAEAMDLFVYACSLPVDAVIVQDIGLARLMHSTAPEMKLSASTQMSVHTPAGAELCRRMGFSRVVLARELSQKEIEEIKKNTCIELEVFVHGALCMSVSGQCYMSAVLGSRSGNRGACAQPCRLPFNAQGGAEHVLSLKDLSVIRHIEELALIGVCSLKIEGRMKRPEYVAAAVTACRAAREGENVPHELAAQLSAVFSRSGFTDGYFTGSSGKNAPEMFGFRRQEDVSAATRQIFKSLQELYHKERNSVGLRMKFKAVQGDPSALELSDGVNRVKAYGDVPQDVVARPLCDERVRQQLSKLGGTPYFAQEISTDIEAGSTLSAASLNALRRSALEALSEKRRYKAPVVCTGYRWIPEQHICEGTPKMRAVFRNACTIPASARDFEFIFIPLETPADKFQELIAQGFSVGAELPRVLFGRENQLRTALNEVYSAGVRHVMVQNLGEIIPSLEAGMTVHGGFGLNIMNTAALEAAAALGLADCELSIELAAADIRKMGGKLPRGTVCYGRLPLMLTRNCPAALQKGGCPGNCGKCGITDRKGRFFPVLCRAGACEVFNPVTLCMFDRLQEVKNVDFMLLRFTVENSVEIEEITEACAKRFNPLKEYTRGLFYRGVE